MTIHEIALARSGLVIQWDDATDAWLCDTEERVRRADWPDDSAVLDTEPNWADSPSFTLPQEVWAGESPSPTWWAVACAPGEGAAVSAVLRDGSNPLIVRLGPVLVCEWISLPQILDLTIDGRDYPSEPFRPFGDGPPPFDYECSHWRNHGGDLSGYSSFG